LLKKNLGNIFQSQAGWNTIRWKYGNRNGTFLKKCWKKCSVHPSDIAAIGITNQRETAIVWDKKTGIPVYPAIVWQDKRTAAICEELKQAGLENYVKENTGLVIDAYFPALK